MSLVAIWILLLGILTSGLSSLNGLKLAWTRPTASVISYNLALLPFQLNLLVAQNIYVSKRRKKLKKFQFGPAAVLLLSWLMLFYVKSPDK